MFMTDRMQYSESDPRHHTAWIKQMLTDVINHAREDVSKISDPKAQALFETTAEVLTGLRKAYEGFEEKNEEAWRKVS
jgi:desulfoferrodoxin (superoxide reductase-like protein)